MTIASRAQERISEQLLLEWTNQGVPAATSVNTTFLGYVADDVEGVFVAETGLAYDDSDKIHVKVAVDGVMARFQELSGVTGRNSDKIAERWQRGLIAIAQTSGSERRLLPTSNSVLDPSDETNNTRPDHDRGRWRDFVPNSTGADQDDDE